MGKKKEVSAMTMALEIIQEDQKMIAAMDKFIQELKNQDPDVARQEAWESLYRTGVITEDGKLKESIVSWD